MITRLVHGIFSALILLIVLSSGLAWAQTPGTVQLDVLMIEEESAASSPDSVSMVEDDAQLIYGLPAENCVANVLQAVKVPGVEPIKEELLSDLLRCLSSEQQGDPSRR